MTYSTKDILRISYPILVSLLMEQLIGLTDTAFLGRVGEVELGASAIASIFYTIFFMASFGFSIGAQILIARRNGEKQYKEIGTLFYQGLYFQLALAVIILLQYYHVGYAQMAQNGWRYFIGASSSNQVADK